MNGMTDFDRLLEAAEVIARHVDYPGKERVIAQCHTEVQELGRAGRLTIEQQRLLSRLIGNSAGPAPTRGPGPGLREM